MKIFKIFLLMILFINIANANTDIKDKNLNNKILKNIRCLVCQGQSVYDSESEFSSTIKLLVKKKINEGKSEKQIYEFLRERYGNWVIFEPELNKNTYILWLLPLLLFLLGGAIIRSKITARSTLFAFSALLFFKLFLTFDKLFILLARALAFLTIVL